MLRSGCSVVGRLVGALRSEPPDTRECMDTLAEEPKPAFVRLDARCSIND